MTSEKLPELDWQLRYLLSEPLVCRKKRKLHTIGRTSEDAQIRIIEERA